MALPKDHINKLKNTRRVVHAPKTEEAMKGLSRALKNYGKALGNLQCINLGAGAASSVNVESDGPIEICSNPLNLPEWKWLWKFLLFFKTKERRLVEKYYDEIYEQLTSEGVSSLQLNSYQFLNKDQWWTMGSRRKFDKVIEIFRVPKSDLPLLMNLENKFDKAIVKFRLKKGI